MRLDEKQANEDQPGGRQNIRGEDIGRGVQALDGAQHRDRRGNQRIAEKQGDAGHRQHQDQRAQPRRRRQSVHRQRRQGEHAALPFVVGAHDEDDVFGGYREHQRPEDHRQDAEDRFRLGGQPAGGAEGFADGVEGAGADVTEDDADGPDDQRDAAGTLFPARAPGAIDGCGDRRDRIVGRRRGGFFRGFCRHRGPFRRRSQIGRGARSAPSSPRSAAGGRVAADLL